MLTTPESNEVPHTCGQPYNQHINNLLVALTEYGLGALCVDTYKALVDVAETIREFSNFPTHIPNPQLVNEILADNRRKVEEQISTLREEFLSQVEPLGSVM